MRRAACIAIEKLIDFPSLSIEDLIPRIAHHVATARDWLTRPELGRFHLVLVAFVANARPLARQRGLGRSIAHEEAPFLLANSARLWAVAHIDFLEGNATAWLPTLVQLRLRLNYRTRSEIRALDRTPEREANDGEIHPYSQNHDDPVGHGPVGQRFIIRARSPDQRAGKNNECCEYRGREQSNSWPYADDSKYREQGGSEPRRSEADYHPQQDDLDQLQHEIRSIRFIVDGDKDELNEDIAQRRRENKHQERTKPVSSLEPLSRPRLLCLIHSQYPLSAIRRPIAFRNLDQSTNVNASYSLTVPVAPGIVFALDFDLTIR
jgi:hypothetical protein